MLTLEQLTEILSTSFKVPHSSVRELFGFATYLAETVEKVASTVRVVIPVSKRAVIAKSKKPVLRKRTHTQKKVTRKTLRDLGLDYPTVTDCAHDLVITKGMTHEQAAKRMGSSPDRIRSCLANFAYRKTLKLNAARRLLSEERKA